MGDSSTKSSLEAVTAELEQTRRQLDELRAQNERLQALLGTDRPLRADAHAQAWEPILFSEAETLPLLDNESAPEAKLAVYRSLFAGRDDVYAQRWENPRTGKAGWSPAIRGGWSSGQRAQREYLPLSDEVVASHLSGRMHAGLYPLVTGDVCRLLACDFDGEGWLLDALAYLDTCQSSGVPAALERSRSGDGAHVWIFFTAWLPASSARALGAALLREAMTARVELDLASYDRLFPSQDFVPSGSFGNLIALPLQGDCRKQGRTVFLNPATVEPWEDQWAFLSSVARLTPTAASALTEGLRPVEVGPTAIRLRRPAQDEGPPAPAEIRATLGAWVSLERIGLPPSLVASLKHLASLHNPEFYEKERMRFSTWGIPRLYRCYQEDLEYLHLPRGLLPQIDRIVSDAGSRLVLTDQRPEPSSVPLTFVGALSAQQRQAVDALLAHDLGLLVAPPGEGKTVMACAVIGHHQVPTLVLVDRKPLTEQWRERVCTLLGLDRSEVGQIGGGRSRRTRIVDLATIQTLARRDDNEALFAEYGLVVVDECHHIPARTFDLCLREATTRRWLGLTATPYRRQGLEEIIEMHCGPVRHTITVKGSMSTALLRRDLIVHETLTDPEMPERAHIQEIFKALAEDNERTCQITSDVVEAIGRGRNCLVLTRRVAHVESICASLRAGGLEPLLLRGGLTKQDRSAVTERLDDPTPESPLLLVATASFIGEGFDCPRLDTVFLAFPVAWKGNVVQYVGRVMRAFDGKEHVEVHDYVDVLVPVVKRMHTKRLAGYAALGFEVPRATRRR